MEDSARYTPTQLLTQSEPIAALLREYGFATSRLIETEHDQAVIGSWTTADHQVFQAYYHHDARTGQQTFELKARRGEYRAEMGRMLVRSPEDVRFLLGAWHLLATARQTTTAAPEWKATV